MFKQLLKLFYRTKPIIISYTLLVLIMNYYMYKLNAAFITEIQNVGYKQSTDFLFYLSDIRNVSVVTWAFWFLVSLEYFSITKKQNFTEVFALNKKNIKKIYLTQLGVVFSAVVIYTCNVIGYMLVGFYCLEGENYYVENIVKIFLVDICLVAFAAIGMGILISHIKRKILQYICFLFLILMMVSDYLCVFRDAAGESGKNIYLLFSRLLSIVPRDITCTPDFVYGLAFEQYRIEVLIMWSCFVILLLVIPNGGKIRNRLIVFTLSILVITSAFEAARSQSTLEMDNSLYYESLERREEFTKKIEKNFKIEKYDIRLKISRELEAVCKMKILNTKNEKDYYFTLNHGYKIESCEDENGNLLKYDVLGDYFVVHKQNLDELKIVYRGNGNIFYSNTNAVFLPGCFAWYPKEGAQKIYDENYQYCGEKEEKKDFHLVVENYPKKIYSNLENRGCEYFGYSENVFLNAGNLENFQCGKYDFILPKNKGNQRYKNNQWEKEIFNEVKGICDYLNINKNEIILPRKILVRTDSTSFCTIMNNTYFYDDYFMISGQTDGYGLLEAWIKNYEKEGMGSIVMQLRLDAKTRIEDFEKRSSWISKEQYTENDYLYDLILDKMEKKGIRKVAREIIKQVIYGKQNNIKNDIHFVESL